MTRTCLIAVLAALASAAFTPARAEETPPAPAVPETPAATAPEPAAPNPSGRPRAFEDLKAIYDGTDLVVQFQVDAVQARPEVAPRLTWEVDATLVGVLRGTLAPGKLFVHVESVIRAFDLQRTDLLGKQFVAAVKPLTDATQRRFQLLGGCAFLADSKEAEVFRQLADADATRGSGSEDISLQVRLLAPVFPVEGPKQIEILLTNNGKESATYVQQPLSERDGKLYLTGQGHIRISDASGRSVSPKDSVLVGQVPPGQSTPALILPRATFKEILDLDKHFELSAGRYTLAVMLAPPSGRGRIVSNGQSFQVGAVNLPEPEPAKDPPTPVPLAPSRPPPRPARTRRRAPTSPTLPPTLPVRRSPASPASSGPPRPGSPSASPSTSSSASSTADLAPWPSTLDSNAPSPFRSSPSPTAPSPSSSARSSPGPPTAPTDPTTPLPQGGVLLGTGHQPQRPQEPRRNLSPHPGGNRRRQGPHLRTLRPDPLRLPEARHLRSDRHLQGPPAPGRPAPPRPPTGGSANS